MSNFLALSRLAVFGSAFAFAFATSLHAEPETDRTAVLYKNPQCGCCENYADYLRENGFTVEVKPTQDLVQISQQAGVPEEVQGCHTVFIGDYVVSGHVPISIVDKMLTEQPDIAGVTLPGMPMGSPGMGGDKQAPFTVFAVDQDVAPTVYAVE